MIFVLMNNNLETDIISFFTLHQLKDLDFIMKKMVRRVLKTKNIKFQITPKQLVHSNHFIQNVNAPSKIKNKTIFSHSQNAIRYDVTSLPRI
uniref:Uncharacterized protein n=1 Tax=Strongyloides venezuelensis TaxID=75913 RepID=A0A0K0G692_STRVS